MQAAKVTEICYNVTKKLIGSKYYNSAACLNIFDQILKRWNLIDCGPELRSGPDMQRDYGPASLTRILEMQLHPVCCLHGWSRIRLFFRDYYLMWLRT